ncbi:MAG: DUF4956 domain-containing protein [Clostridia bacterium]|nr:DUF4956 domain-containing protein [Clostridia bacterium]MBR2613205.1 DUF4956 domain-containing protein [Clostridia bacterium]
MPDVLFKGLFDNSATSVISITDFLLCLGVALLAGLIMAFSYTFKSRYTKSFIVTLAILPAVVCVVIMMVNGNIGTGVAVAGAFSLVRFRSAPGSAKEIAMLFLAMGSGLIAGMGYLGFALLFAIILCLVTVLYNAVTSRLGTGKREARYKTLKITIPEDLDYTDVFNELFAKYTKKHELVRVKTTNMGSMFRLTYDIELSDVTKEKEFIDRLRERNGNLEIMISKQDNSEIQL